MQFEIQLSYEEARQGDFLKGGAGGINAYDARLFPVALAKEGVPANASSAIPGMFPEW
ncbi:hypothetical protein ACFOUO_02390 [Salinithrix halophila]|uniref:Uncharacterized protein n=1 Tax=Salinithrix halophila TaxID=1485204 RepID=A0ABV8JD26_9BACL